LGEDSHRCKLIPMSVPRDPHEIDLAVLFPSLPVDRREEMRDFLDGYCEIALQVFERLEREENARIDTPQQASYSEGKVDSPKIN
jgi:hypothetical protein